MDDRNVLRDEELAKVLREDAFTVSLEDIAVTDGKESTDGRTCNRSKRIESAREA
jgi:hypothetical protein